MVLDRNVVFLNDHDRTRSLKKLWDMIKSVFLYVNMPNSSIQQDRRSGLFFSALDIWIIIFFCLLNFDPYIHFGCKDFLCGLLKGSLILLYN